MSAFVVYSTGFLIAAGALLLVNLIVLQFIKETELSIIATIFIFLGIIIVALDYFYIENVKDFLTNLLVEVNGMFIDILMLGIIYNLIKKFHTHDEEFDQLKGELEDFRGWNNEMASLKIKSIIRRATKLLLTERHPYPYYLNLENCYLKDTDLRGLALSSALKNANLEGANLEGAIVKNPNWIEDLKAQNIVGYDEIVNTYFVDKEDVDYIKEKSIFPQLSYWALPVYEIKKRQSIG